MGIARELPPPVMSIESNARRHGRVRCQKIESNIGEVVDLSASGARIRRRRRYVSQPGSMVNMEIEGLDGAIRVLGRVVWTRRFGFFHHQVGVIFEDVSAPVRKALASIARCAPANAVMGRIALEQARRSA
jgi:PilZ domain